MRSAIKDFPAAESVSEWLLHSGLNPIEASLAQVHYKTANRLVDMASATGGALRTRLSALLRGVQTKPTTRHGSGGVTKMGADQSAGKSAVKNRGLVLLRRLT